jgi:hypothetical protein
MNEITEFTLVSCMVLAFICGWFLTYLYFDLKISVIKPKGKFIYEYNLEKKRGQKNSTPLT